MSNKEILTLQFGHYSNYIGAHWWNLQEKGFQYNSVSPSEINHDVLYREGLTTKNEVTFTPRLLLVDLKGSLKSLLESGDLYDPVPDSTKTSLEWEPNLIEVKKNCKFKKNEFQENLQKSNESNVSSANVQEFQNSISVWSDFLYARFHPRTVNVVNEYQHCNENTPFDAYPLGTSVWKSPHFEEDFSDKIRMYVEECDNFEGFHLLTDCTNAFSGLSSSCLEHLQDDYARKSILVFPVIPSQFPDHNFKTDEEKVQSIINDSVRVLNLALSFDKFSSYSSLFVPLCTGDRGWRQPGSKRDFKHVIYDPKLPYHSSAILASALDTFTLNYRLKSDNFTLKDLCADLNNYGRKAAAASLCLPFPLEEDNDLLGCLDNWKGSLFQSITPNCTIGTDKLMQHVVLRGISEDRLKKPLQYAEKQRDLPAYKCESISEMLRSYFSYSTYATATSVSVVHKSLDVTTPFPMIFDGFVNRNGYVTSKARLEDIRVERVPVLAGLHSGSQIGDMLASLCVEVNKVKYTKFPQFSNNLERDEYEESLHNLNTLKECYEDQYVI